MDFGFIGAGKAGFSLGKFLTVRGVHVTGYYSRSPQSSLEAAEFTNTRQYIDLAGLAKDSDGIFLTVPDGEIASVWAQLKELPIQNKMIIHCSGALSTAVFCGIEQTRAYGYSIHPLVAMGGKYTSWRDLERAFFTIEGSGKHLGMLKEMLESFGNPVEVISAENKTLYHAAAVIASNLYVGLVDVSERILCESGFTPEHAHEALGKLIAANADNIVKYGTTDALTGPVERNDARTVAAHLASLTGEESEIYRILSKEIVPIAKRRHPEWDFTKMEKELDK